MLQLRTTPVVKSVALCLVAGALIVDVVEPKWAHLCAHLRHLGLARLHTSWQHRVSEKCGAYVANQHAV